jgi:hypothetical protein
MHVKGVREECGRCICQCASATSPTITLQWQGRWQVPASPEQVAMPLPQTLQPQVPQSLQRSALGWTLELELQQQVLMWEWSWWVELRQGHVWRQVLRQRLEQQREQQQG